MSREAFEKWARGQRYRTDRHSDSGYEYADTIIAWQAWQAATAHATRWRPISEAPKDGTGILGWSDVTEEHLVCWWSEPEGQWLWNVSMDTDDGHWVHHECDPSSWMELPEPPQ